MKISRLYINHFGKLSNRTIELDDGITIISGENESGKSTLHSFISAMLLGLERGRGRAAKSDTYTHYKPWDGGIYGGTIDIEKGDNIYSITRNFSDDPGVIITNETTCREIAPTSSNLSRIFGGITPTSYKNTISVSQLSVGTGGALADELRNHIVNLRTAGSFNLDVTGAINKLKTQKKRIESGFNKPASEEAEELSVRIASMEEDLAKSGDFANINFLESAKAAKSRDIAEAEARCRDLKARVENADSLLREKRILSVNDSRALTEQVDGAISNLEDFRAKHRINSRSFAPVLYLIFLIIGIAAMGFGGYMFYKSRLLLPYVPIAGAGLLLFVFALINFISAKKYRRYVRDFSLLYKEYIGEWPGEVSDAKIADLKAQPLRYKNLLEAMVRGNFEYNNTQGNIGLYRSELEKLNVDLEIAKRDSWQREQKEEALTSLRLRLDMLDDTLKKNAAIKEDSEAITLAINTIETISKDVFESFGHFLEETTSQLFASMTDGAYQGVSINDEFDISLLQDGRKVALSSVSTGTLDQIYLALRLACIEFLWPDESMPIMLDDTFAMYDKDRLACTLSWLAENYSGQILVFTCHTREEVILNNLKIPYSLVEM